MSRCKRRLDKGELGDTPCPHYPIKTRKTYVYVLCAYFENCECYTVRDSRFLITL